MLAAAPTRLAKGHGMMALAARAGACWQPSSAAGSDTHALVTVAMTPPVLGQQGGDVRGGEKHWKLEQRCC